eukprot:GHRQ01035537.1.p1 GENE.GHRQ01035537.1~~GHRQ01035537.1.p1  ORF type:complete len:107 (-),score=19.77 GHRQ01035537.1:630-950(-)
MNAAATSLAVTAFCRAGYVATRALCRVCCSALPWQPLLTFCLDADVTMPLIGTNWLTRALVMLRMPCGPNGWLLSSSTCTSSNACSSPSLVSWWSSCSTSLAARSN